MATPYATIADRMRALKGRLNSLNNSLEFPLTHSFQDFEKTFRCVLSWFLFPSDKNTRPKSNYFLCYSTQGYGRFTHYFRLNYIALSGLSSLHSISPQTSSMAELGGAFDTHSEISFSASILNKSIRIAAWLQVLIPVVLILLVFWWWKKWKNKKSRK